MLVIIWSVNAVRRRGEEEEKEEREGEREVMAGRHIHLLRTPLNGKSMQFKFNSADILRTFYAYTHVAFQSPT